MTTLRVNRMRKIALFLLVIMFSLNLAADTLQVYSTSTIPVKSREKALKKDEQLKGYSITTFGKFREFLSASQSTKPTFIIAPAHFSQMNKDYEPIYQFTKASKDSFQFLILSIDPKWNIKNFASGNVGIVDERGRKETAQFIHKEIGQFKRIKRVTKTDDLMPLLVLENADYIIIRPDNYGVLKQKFTTKTQLIGKSPPFLLPQIFALKGTSKNTIETIGKISKETIKSLGFDNVRQLK